jgi:hypothetical protein
LALGQNPYITDPENIRNNPAWGSYYRNMAWVNYGLNKYSGQHIGVNLGIKKHFIAGGFLNWNSSPGTSLYSIDNLNVRNYNKEHYLNSEIFLCADVSPMFSFGAGVSVSGKKNKFEDYPKYGADAGVVVRPVDFLIVDAAYTIFPAYSYPASDYPVDQITRKVESYNLRLFYLVSKEFTIVPQVNYNHYKEYYAYYYGKSRRYINYTEFKLGSSYKTASFLLSGGAGYSACTTNDYNTHNYSNINLGAEAYLNDYFTARIGYDGAYGINREPLFRHSDLSLGLGAAYCKVQIDGVLIYDFRNKEIPKYNGIYLSVSYKY